MFITIGESWTTIANHQRNFENTAAKMRTCLTTFSLLVEFGAVQKRVNLVDLVESFQASFFLENVASIQP